MRRGVVAVAVVVLVLVVGGGAYLLARHDDGHPTATKPAGTPTPAPAPPAPTPTRSSCPGGNAGTFAPREVSIRGIGTRPVLALHRDGNGVPGIAPLTSAGKWEFAWDLDQHVLAGQRRGNTLFNAHTWPDGTALGNALLAHLHPGDRILVRGDGGQRCYTVSRRYEVDASAKVPEFFVNDGPPRLALSVCSGRRLGPADWTKRTVWLAQLDS